jgi:short-subunit dehydrogenase
MVEKKNIVIGGVGDTSELSIVLIKKLIEKNYRVFGIARSQSTLESLKEQIGSPEEFNPISLDLLDEKSVAKEMSNLESSYGPIYGYIHNVGKLFRGAFLKSTFEDFKSSLETNFETAIPISQALLKSMLPPKEGVLIFTGATASIKGSANFSPFASAKFALRGFTQSLAREFAPQGIHVCHVLVDGVIWGKRAKDTFKMDENSCISAYDLADIYLNILTHKKRAWSNEVDVRSYMEKF